MEFYWRYSHLPTFFSFSEVVILQLKNALMNNWLSLFMRVYCIAKDYIILLGYTVNSSTESGLRGLQKMTQKQLLGLLFIRS